MCTVFYVPLRTEVCFVFLSRKCFASKRVVKVFFVAPMKVKRRVSHSTFNVSKYFWQKCYEIIRGKPHWNISRNERCSHTYSADEWCLNPSFDINWNFPLIPTHVRTAPSFNWNLDPLLCCVALSSFSTHNYVSHCLKSFSKGFCCTYIVLTCTKVHSLFLWRFELYLALCLNFAWLFALNWLFLFTSMWRV